MKIVLAAGLYPPDIGGPSRYAAMIVNELPVHGIEVAVVPFSTVRSLPKLVRHLAYTWRLWRTSRDADGIYALDPMSVGVGAAVCAFLRRLPLVVRLGGDYAWEQGVQRYGLTETLDEYTAQRSVAPWRVRVMAGIQTTVVMRAAAVIVPSVYLGGIIASWGVPQERIHVIYSAHTVPTQNESRTALRQAYNFSGTTLVSIARLTPWKGMKTLVELIARRRARGETIMLVIGGDGPERSSLERLVADYSLNDVVRFLGALSFDEVFRVVRAADIFLLDTAYEGLSHQLIEVMAIGTPIVTTPVGGNTELLTHRREALLVPVGDVTAYDEAVSEILADQLLREGLIARARERALQFAAVEAVPSLVSLLREICGSKHT
jgi:glycosyltransferase involved in cell wall biosynthesis